MTMKFKTVIPVTILSAAVIAVSYFFNPVHWHFYPPCVFRSITSLNCPGCGAARALHQLLNGNISAALGYNPLIVASLPILLFFGIRALIAHIKKTAAPPVFKSAFWPWFLAVIIILFGILRNIPVYPFTLLAPH